MTKYLPFVYDEGMFLTNQKCFIVTGKYVAYLTAFFNSSLFKYCFRDSFPERQGGVQENLVRYSLIRYLSKRYQNCKILISWI